MLLELALLESIFTSYLRYLGNNLLIIFLVR